MQDLEFLPGGRRISTAALLEKIEDEFTAETAARPDILLNTVEDSARRDLVRDVIDYVLATESITLPRADRLALLDLAYRHLFGFGPLDQYLADESVTEISIDSPDRTAVRYGAGEPVEVEAHFNDVMALERTVSRVLAMARAQLTDADPILEVGTVLAGRPARMATVMPPISSGLKVELRLHPKNAETLASLVAKGFMDESATRLLDSILKSGHGLMIAGEVGTGKTTLLEALLPLLPSHSIIVERAAELRVPADMNRLAAVPFAEGQTPISFAEQLVAALQKQPPWLVIDEIRFDEASAMWEILTAGQEPRCLWAFRGSTNPMRLKAAFSMSVRRAQPGIDQEFIFNALLARLPFVALLGRHDQKLRLISINEWRQAENNVVLQELWPVGAASSRAIGWV